MPFIFTQLVAICFFFFRNALQLTGQFPVLHLPIHRILRDSMSFSASFSAPFNVCSQTGTSFCASLASWPSMAASLIPSLKTSLGSSKSAFLRHNLPLQSLNSRCVFSKAQFSGVSARAATDKNIYDFTVKVFLCLLLFLFVWVLILQYCSSGVMMNCGLSVLIFDFLLNFDWRIQFRCGDIHFSKSQCWIVVNFETCGFVCPSLSCQNGKEVFLHRMMSM